MKEQKFFIELAIIPDLIKKIGIKRLTRLSNEFENMY